MIDLPKFELPFFAALLLLLVLARFFGELFERMKQPAMIGEIIAGIILGPTLLNFIHRTEELKVISDLGVFLLVILAGLEINFDDILKDLQEEASGLDEFEIWLNNGIERGWITEPFCNTHEGDPYMSEEEAQEWEEGGDPCQVVVKIIEN